MKWAAIILLMALAAIGCSSNAPVTAAALQPTAWTSPDGDLTLSYPGDWTSVPDDRSQAMLLLAAPSPASENFRDSMSVLAQDFPDTRPSLEDFVMSGRTEVGRAYNFVSVTDAAMELGGQPAWRLDYTAYGNGEPHYFAQVVAMRATHAVVITFTFGSTAKFRASHGVVDGVLHSVHWNLSSTLPASQASP